MTRMTKHLLTVLMDGIRDANMLMDYAHVAREADENEISTWFSNHAQSRLTELKKDRTDVFEEVDLCKRAKDGDEIARALMEHIDSQIDALYKRMR